MKKLFASLFVAFAMIAMVSCSSNPAIEAAEAFINNQTEENAEKFVESLDALSPDQQREFLNWTQTQEYEVRQLLNFVGE